MVFEYSDYYFQTLSLPIFIISFFLLFLGISIFGPVKKGGQESLTILIAKVSLALVVCIIMVSICAKTLTNGGIYLRSENESDVVVETGTIESICEPSEIITGFKATHNGRQRHGADVIIDGKRYFAVTCDGFEIGDYVEIEYLPKSKFILSIYKSEAPTDSIVTD